MVLSLDDCELIKTIVSWAIELILEKNFVEEIKSPDWYGYKRIDKIRKV